MKLFRILASAVALAFIPVVAFAQTSQGSSPLSGAKGGTNNSFMQFTGPATSMKTFTLPNVSGTIALLAESQTLTNKTINCANNTCTPAAQAAYTFLGNNTGSSAVPTAVDIAGLTTKASPASGDYVILSDQAASGAWKKASVSSIASAGSVSSIAGNTGAFTLSGLLTNSTNDLRVTGAVKSDQTTATSTATAVTPAVQQNHPSAVKAWFRISSTCSTGTCTLAASYGITSVVFNATGDYTVTFSTAFADANYIPSCIGQSAGANLNAQAVTTFAAATNQTSGLSTNSTTAVRLLTANGSTGTLVNQANWGCMFIGNS